MLSVKDILTYDKGKVSSVINVHEWFIFWILVRPSPVSSKRIYTKFSSIAIWEAGKVELWVNKLTVPALMAYIPALAASTAAIKYVYLVDTWYKLKLDPGGITDCGVLAVVRSVTGQLSNTDWVLIW